MERKTHVLWALLRVIDLLALKVPLGYGWLVEGGWCRVGFFSGGSCRWSQDPPPHKIVAKILAFKGLGLGKGCTSQTSPLKLFAIPNDQLHA